ncbi:uncharacterized protein BDR25DRAFT_236738 [Lindgomyces ingoldianus]|uniref:Uncharacterized protein n=1 Tax=Lindgomyces ingoldianus TaxID=673940 RepID=A0ACB6QIZ9_9PLEO|nr:uncharacterized protein BDR25DRAFT_236738 [Lindgomyces ingoldianus]KAF2466568.1 hypothetical protein BDR25DRAFT_236738 [Lindgomyces ingoldianus]
MPPQKTSSLKTYFDNIAVTNGDDECRAWLERVLDLKTELATFVADHREGNGTGNYVSFLKGSFNFSFSFSFSFTDGGPDAIIRSPKPGHMATALRDEKVTNEVQVMEYLAQNTTIPLPRVHSWGLTAESLKQLGPFIIMDSVDGMLLSTLLKRQSENGEEVILLNQDFDNTALDKIYYQIADGMLQLSQLTTFTHIGAISKRHGSNIWSVIRRPLTYNMNELMTVAGYPANKFPTAPFDRASDYFRSVANEHLNHLRTQRNLADDAGIVQKRFVARYQFAQLIPKYCVDDAGPFIPFCNDMRPSNMLIDPDTLRITAVLYFEFTNTMPAQFTYDPPWWLLLSGPEWWLDRCSMEEFVTDYKPRMEQFLRALERVGKEASLKKQPSGTLLSTRMRGSWRSGRFWFNYAARKSFEVDGVYWAALHDGSSSVQLFSEAVHAEIEDLTKMKMEQLKAYKEECTA